MSGPIEQALDYVWVPIIAAVVGVWRKATGNETRAMLLEQADLHFEQLRREDVAHFDKLRKEDRELRDAQRAEILGKIDAHHKIIMSKIERIDEKINNRLPPSS